MVIPVADAVAVGVDEHLDDLAVSGLTDRLARVVPAEDIGLELGAVSGAPSETLKLPR